MNIPRLYSVVNIKFSSLRNAVCADGWVIFDVDKMVERKVRRVVCENGWKFQIINICKLKECDGWIDTDQKILDEIGMCLTNIKSVSVQRQNHKPD